MGLESGKREFFQLHPFWAIGLVTQFVFVQFPDL